MRLKPLVSKSAQWIRLGLTSILLSNLALGLPSPASANPAGDGRTKTPIKHVIIIIGENRTFDHIFATYKPRNGQTVRNLLSEGIIREDGTPGPNYSLALQSSAVDMAPSPFLESPMSKSLFSVLPTPLAGGPTNAPISDLADAEASENGLTPAYSALLTTGGTGLKGGTPDTRISYDGEPVTNLPPGPFQLTPGVPYDAYAASPVHRFYQMWQQEDCNAAYITASNPAGCKADLFPWVEQQIGAGSNGNPPGTRAYDAPSGEGATAMGFYNMLQGDAPVLKELVDHYAMSDNYHQAVMGGTGANHIMLGTGDAIWFSDGNGNAAVPPHNQEVAAGTANQGTVDEVEDPDPLPGTNDWYTEDGYGGGSFGSPSFGGGSYSACADLTQPGVPAIVTYLQSLPRPINPNCETGHYYILNNYNPGYFGDGTNAYTDPNNANTVFTVPPSSVRNIGDDLLENNISWAYYGDQWDAYLNDKYQLNYGTVGSNSDQYCTICNPFQYSTSIMTNATVRTTHLKDTIDLYAAIQSVTLPAVSFVKPSGWVDGHPASSKLDLFEGFVLKIVDMVKKNPALWQSTAIFITFDEGGGYYDSGYVQPLDFFGDGTRIPLIVVSPFTDPGHISHTYTDHVSLLKFVEANWGLPPITSRSRDNFPNPVTTHDNPYVPTNSPAIGDLMDLFDFSHQSGDRN
jgi:phospholipase C